MGSLSSVEPPEAAKPPAVQEIRVLLASDFVLLRAGLRMLLSSVSAPSARINVIGECDTTPEETSRWLAQSPGVLLFHIRFQQRDEATALVARSRAVSPQTRVVALCESAEPEFVLRLLGAGVTGYLSYAESITELVDAIETVARGEVFLCPVASGVLVDGYRSRRSSGRLGGRHGGHPT